MADSSDAFEHRSVVGVADGDCVESNLFLPLRLGEGGRLRGRVRVS